MAVYDIFGFTDDNERVKIGELVDGYKLTLSASYAFAGCTIKVDGGAPMTPIEFVNLLDSSHSIYLTTLEVEHLDGYGFTERTNGWNSNTTFTVTEYDYGSDTPNTWTTSGFYDMSVYMATPIKFIFTFSQDVTFSNLTLKWDSSTPVSGGGSVTPTI